MAVGCYFWVEAAGEFVLSSRGEVLLVFEDDDLVFVEGFVDYFEICFVQGFQVCAADFGSEVDGGALGRGEFVDGDFGFDGHVGMSFCSLVRGGLFV